MLTVEEKKLFTQLFDYGLFDPSKIQGCRRVWAKSAFLGTYERVLKMDVPGWLIPAEANGGRAEIVLDSQMRVDAREVVEQFDFVERAKAFVEKIEKNDGKLLEEDYSFYTNIFPRRQSDKYLYWAAWLQRLGQNELAERLMNYVLADQGDFAEFHQELREEFAWQHGYAAARYFRFGEDQRALEYAERAERMVATLPHGTYFFFRRL